jgi:PPOX class probable F420-dependent enzyme
MEHDVAIAASRDRSAHHGHMALTDPERRFLESQRRVVLVTVAPDGQPRPIPICFVLAHEAAILYTPLDDKPKATDDPRALARVRDIRRDRRVAILSDRWDEDWTRLAWLRAEGGATLLEPGPEHALAVAALRETYPQYATHRLDARPLIRIEIGRVTTWGALD